MLDLKPYAGARTRRKLNMVEFLDAISTRAIEEGVVALRASA